MKQLRKSFAAFLVGTLAAAVIGLLSLTAAAQEQPAGRKFAFLVGVVKYNHAKLRNLEYAEVDVEELADVLRKQGFKEVLVLTSHTAVDDPGLKPTAEHILTRLREFLSKAKVGKDDLFLVGLAGHGIQPLGSDESYYCPFDANPTMVTPKGAQTPVPVEPDTLVPITGVLKILDDSGVGEKLLLVDACRNDPEARGRRGVDHVSVAALPPQTGVLLSCAPGEFAFEHKSLGKGHGVFFYYVIEGMKGDARDTDGEVTWDSLRAFVKKRVPQAVSKLYGAEGGIQRPNDIGNLIGESPQFAAARIIVPPRTDRSEEPKDKVSGPRPQLSQPPAREKPRDLHEPAIQPQEIEAAASAVKEAGKRIDELRAALKKSDDALRIGGPFWLHTGNYSITTNVKGTDPGRSQGGTKYESLAEAHDGAMKFRFQGAPSFRIEDDNGTILESQGQIGAAIRLSDAQSASVSAWALDKARLAAAEADYARKKADYRRWLRLYNSNAR